MVMNPVQSFQHTLQEISVNRANPCELVRELISNSYDAKASKILVFPLIQYRGLVFFDNGLGLSAALKDEKNGILPYVAFFSIGKGTKIRGEQIGYKCQGSKLCFAARRCSIITRCADEAKWRWKIIDNPKKTLDLNYDLTPGETEVPWQLLREQMLAVADERTQPILDYLSESFFLTNFAHGTMIIIEDFETDNYDGYFSVAEPKSNYLYNYIRHYTAHGDVRRISAKEHGFRPSDAKAVRTAVGPDRKCEVEIWTAGAKGRNSLVSIPQGWPYLPPPQQQGDSPSAVRKLPDGRFSARHATSFQHGDRYYSIIFAIDGNRRALEGYDALARRGSSRCGIKLSEQRGVLLSSNGIVVCPYMSLLEHPLLKEWNILQEGVEHFTLIIDGTFDLVTNRDSLAPSSVVILNDQKFVEKIQIFLQQIKNSKEGEVLTQLAERLNRETTRFKEDQYLSNNEKIRIELPLRDSFVVNEIPALENRRFYAPAIGEEHFVGALYTLFAHLTPSGHSLSRFWARPLTFSGLGIDAIAVADEAKSLTNGNLLSLEYKYHFDTNDEFNHPLNVTNRIICWDASWPSIGDTVSDSYKYDASVKEILSISNETIGFILSDVRHRHDIKDIPHEVYVLSLRALLTVTYKVQFRPGVKVSKVSSKSSKKKS